MSKLLFFLALILAAQASVAAYITDKLLAGYYASPDLTSQPVRALPNGTPMEILEEKGKFSRVRLGDNSEGWVETRFITLEKPAKMMLLELQAKYATLKRQTDSRAEGQRDAVSIPSPSAADMRQEDELAQKQILQSQTNPPDQESATERAGITEQQLRLENALLRDRLQRIRELSSDDPATETDPRPETFQPWVLPLIMLGLLLSFIAGIAFKNYRIARRAGRTGQSG